MYPAKSETHTHSHTHTHTHTRVCVKSDMHLGIPECMLAMYIEQLKLIWKMFRTSCLSLSSLVGLRGADVTERVTVLEMLHLFTNTRFTTVTCSTLKSLD